MNWPKVAKRTKYPAGTLGLDLYAYGGDAAASALADYMEARALLASPIGFSEVDESIKDHGWGSSHTPLYVDGSDSDDPVAWSDSVRSVLEQREECLRGLYPFKIDSGRVRLKTSKSPYGSYSRLLIICIAHAYGYKGSPATTLVFERLVAGSMSRFGLPSHGVGTGSRSNKTFARALSAAATGVGLTSMHNPLPRRTSVKDGGVDVISSLTWRDGRPGQFVWLTQATCGESSTWKRKLKEPEPEVWRQYLQEEIPPTALLAVPHHVELRQFRELLRTRAGSVLDRLRLVPNLPSPIDGESEMHSWFRRLDPQV